MPERKTRAKILRVGGLTRRESQKGSCKWGLNTVLSVGVSEAHLNPGSGIKRGIFYLNFLYDIAY